MTALLVFNGVLMAAVVVAIAGWLSWAIIHEPKVVARQVRRTRPRVHRDRVPARAERFSGRGVPGRA